MTSTIALLVGALSLIIAYLAFRRADAVEKRLAETNNKLGEIVAQMAQAAGETREGLAGLRLEMRQRAGEPGFSPDMTIADAMSVHPKVTEVLASFHLGGCSHCAVSDVDTIEGACQSYGIDQRALMTALNQLIDPKSGGSTGPIKVANMKLEI
jgi:hybrid cluster-associated redox disulfide protein